MVDRIRRQVERLVLNYLADEASALAVRAGAAQWASSASLARGEVGVREGRRFRNAGKLSGLLHQRPSTSRLRLCT